MKKSGILAVIMVLLFAFVVLADDGGKYFECGFLKAELGVELKDTLDVIGTASFNAGVTFDDTTNFVGEASFDDDVIFDSTITATEGFTLGAVEITATGTELNYVGGVTSAIQTQLNAKEAADAAVTKTDEVETITANWVNTANPWADNEVADDITCSNYLALTDTNYTDSSDVKGWNFMNEDSALYATQTDLESYLALTDTNYTDSSDVKGWNFMNEDSALYATQTDISLKAPLAAPTLTGTVSISSVIQLSKHTLAEGDSALGRLFMTADSLLVIGTGAALDTLGDYR